MYMLRKVVIRVLASLAVLLLLFTAIVVLEISDIKSQPPSKAQIEYREYYKEQAAKEYLTEDEYNELKRRGELMLQGEISNDPE